MNNFFKVLIIAVSFTTLSYGQGSPIGTFQNAVDIGDPAKQGSSAYLQPSQEYSLKGGGYNIWFERDEFHYLHNKIKGDFILTANFNFVGEGVDLHRKVGWMIRESPRRKCISYQCHPAW